MSPPRIRPGSAGSSEPDPPEEFAKSAPDDVVVDEEASFVTDEPSNETAPQVTAPETTTETAPETAPETATEPSERARNETPLAPREAPVTSATPHRRRLYGRIYYGETAVDFVRRRRTWFAISLIVILAGVGSLATRGLNLGIDFVGGTSWTVQTKTLSIATVRTAVGNAGLSGETITILGNNGTRNIEVEAKLPKGQSSSAAQAEANTVAAAMAKVAHTTVNKVSIDTVGPSWGGEITHKAIVALIVFFILIALYISVFFEWRMAFAAIIAVIHDILVTVGIYSLTGLEVTPDTVVAILTILGYSLYDTIVVFDRVRDNLHHLSVRDRMTVTDIVNLSMNQTLARSLNTSLVAIMPIFAVLVLGAEILGATTLQYFGLALLVGLTTGAYSSIFIASPLVAMLKEKEQRFRVIRERLAVRGNDRWLLSASAVAAGTFSEQGLTRRPRGDDGGAEVAGGLGLSSSDDDVLTEERPSRRPTRAPTSQSRRPAARARRKGGRR